MSTYEERLAGSENALAYTQSIIDTVRDPLLVLDHKLQVVTASRAFCQIFQVTNEETEGRPVYSLGNGQWDSPPLRQALEVILPKHSEFDDLEITHAFPKIGTRTMLLNARKIWRPQNHVELILLTIEDVTDRKAAEDKLAVALADLQKVTDELKRSNSDLENFVRVAGHDLRAPLNTIVLFSQFLERQCKDRLDDDGLKFLKLIIDGGKRMSQLLSDLLDYATLTQKSDVQFASVSAKPVCEEAVGNLSAAIQKSGAEICIDIGDDVQVCVEHTLLVSLLQNLVGNAINYAQTSVAPAIQVSVSTQGNAWKFAVQDNGIGIEKRLQQRIFEPFKRLHGSERPGSGIGLSICQRIIERANGKIWVDSEPDKGSTFYFVLPKPSSSQT